MKSKIFFLVFLCIPVLAFSQTTKTVTKDIPSSAAKSGAYYDLDNQGSGYHEFQTDNFDVGKTGGSSSNRRNRGFVKFDLSGVSSNAMNSLTGAKLVFDGLPASGTQSVKISKLWKSDTLCPILGYY